MKIMAFYIYQKRLFRKCRSESIDYAVMEKAQNTVVVAFECWLERYRIVGISLDS